MTRVSIDGIDRPLGNVSPNWLREEIESRRTAGVAVCVRVVVQSGSLHVLFQTPGCPAGGPGGKVPNPTERKLLDRWNELGLNRNDFFVGNLARFLEEIKGL